MKHTRSTMVFTLALLCCAALADTETTGSLLALPELTTEHAPVKSPAVSANDDFTTPAVPTVERPRIYWGTVGEKGGYALDGIMKLAWKANPNWNTYLANHAAAHAALVEACAFPNPELQMEFGSESSDSEGRSNSIWSLGFSQPLQLPGKRAARQAEALAGFPVVQGEINEYANSLRADVREAYWTVQYHAALEQMHGAQVSLTKKQLDFAEARRELGDAGRMDVVNARVELLKSTRDRDAAGRRKVGAMAALDALTGNALGRSFKLSQDFPHQYGRPSLDDAIRAALATHPRLGRLAAELEQKYSGIARQRREWWPDINLGARKSKEYDGDSAAVTAAIEIPLWNRNQGGIARAEADAQKVYAQISVAYNELRRDVETAYQNLMIGREQIGSFDEGLKDAAEEAVGLAWEQFNLGGGGYLDILIARRQLLEVQQGYIQALYDAVTARVRFDQATGR